MFASSFPMETLLEMNLPIRGYCPFPRYENRAAWEKLDPETKRLWIEAAEAQLAFQWPPITAEMYLVLRKTGALKPHWDRFRERRSALGMLALGECLQGQGRYLMQIINGVAAICEEPAWISPLATKPYNYDIPLEINREVDLCSSETAALLAWIDYLLGEAIEREAPRVRARLREMVRAQVIVPYLARDDYWWMGFTKDRINNWNPWCNSCVIMCLLLVEDDPKARAQGLHKVLKSLDKYLETYMPDGCCDEGPMYWGAAGAGLYMCLALLHEASGGRLDFFQNEKLRLIGEYIKKVHIHGEWFVDFADGDAHVFLDSLTYSFGKALSDRGMMGLGARANPVRPQVYEWFHTYQNLKELFMETERAACTYSPEYLKDAWLWHTGVMTARETAGSPAGFFLAAKAGHNLESHNHNDIGSFIVYADGKPLLIDIGTEEYSVKTFSPQRFEIWYTQSQYHNCPGVRGVMQRDGREYCANDVRYACTDEKSSLSMELKAAYPKEAGIAAWQREVALLRAPGAVEVTDRFTLETETDTLCRYLMTPLKPETTPGCVTLRYEGGAARLLYDGDNTEALVEEIPITESRLLWNWGERLYRIILRERGAVQVGTRRLRVERAKV